MVKYLLTLGVWLLCFCLAIGQTAKKGMYKTGKEVDYPILGAAGLGIGATWYLKKQIRTLTPTQINSWDRSLVPDFDRKATRQWSPGLKKWSDVSTYITCAAPFTLLIDQPIRKHFTPVIMMGIESFLLTDFLANATQLISKRPRPYVYNDSDQIPEGIRFEREARFSFFSKRMAQASAMSFMTANIYVDYHPKSKLKPLVWTGAAVLPVVTGVLRYKTGEEYPSDLLVGYLVGAGVGLLVPWLHRKVKKKIEN